MTGAPVLLTRNGAVATLTLNRPKVGNAINLEMAEALLDAVIAVDTDPSVRCVSLTGAGRLFCTGGDVTSFSAAGAELPAVIHKVTAALHGAMSKLARMDKPLMTVVNGPAAGAGLGLAILGDVVLAARSAHFTAAYTAIGLSPDGGATWLVPRLIGLRRAQELLLTNRRVDAIEAARIGLITRAVDDDALSNEAATLAQTLAASPTAALAKTRSLLLSGFETSFETQLESEARAIAGSCANAEGREGLLALIEKRQPRF